MWHPQDLRIEAFVVFIPVGFGMFSLFRHIFGQVEPFIRRCHLRGHNCPRCLCVKFVLLLEDYPTIARVCPQRVQILMDPSWMPRGVASRGSTTAASYN